MVGMVGKRLLMVPILLLAACRKEIPRGAESVHKVGKVDIVDNLSLSGMLESEEAVDLKCEVSGSIQEILKAEGDKVLRGDTILVVDPIQARIKLERDRLALRKSRIELEQALLDLKEARGLRGSGGISRRQVKDLAWRVDLAKIRLSESQSYVEETELILSKSTLISPIEGTLVSLKVKEGEVIVAGTASFGGGTLLGTVADLSRMRVSVGVSELDFPFIKTGDSSSISTEAQPENKFKGRVTFVSPVARAMEGKNIRFFDVRISLESSGPHMVPGINVTASLQLLSLRGVLGVPNELIHSDTGSTGERFVYRLEGGTPEKRAIRAGRTDYIHTHVLEGIKEGDALLTETPAGAESMRSGSALVPAKALAGR